MARPERDSVVFRAEVAKKLRQAIFDRGLSKERAAEELGITRVALYQYLGEKATPKGDVLARAIAKWDLTLEYEGFQLSAQGPRVAPPPQRPAALQLPLLARAQVLRNEKLTVRIATRRNDTSDVHLELKFAG